MDQKEKFIENKSLRPDRPQEIILKKNYPPILIYQMGKVGSSSVYKALKSANIPNSCFHVHQLSDKGLREKEGWLKLNKKKPTDEFRFFKKLKETIDINRDKLNWKILTMAREPVSLEISGVFENMNFLYKQLLDENGKPDKGKTIKYLLERFYKLDISKGYYCNWFDNELKAVFDIDVYSKPYDFNRGFSILNKGNVSALVIRLKDFKRSLKKALCEFLGLEIEPAAANIGSKKDYAKEYKEILESLALPLPICEKIYSSKYARHFYTKNEIVSFIEKWSSKQID